MTHEGLLWWFFSALDTFRWRCEVMRNASLSKCVQKLLRSTFRRKDTFSSVKNGSDRKQKMIRMKMTAGTPSFIFVEINLPSKHLPEFFLFEWNYFKQNATARHIQTGNWNVRMRGSQTTMFLVRQNWVRTDYVRLNVDGATVFWSSHSVRSECFRPDCSVNSSCVIRMMNPMNDKTFATEIDAEELRRIWRLDHRQNRNSNRLPDRIESMTFGLRCSVRRLTVNNGCRRQFVSAVRRTYYLFIFCRHRRQ